MSLGLGLVMHAADPISRSMASVPPRTTALTLTLPGKRWGKTRRPWQSNVFHHINFMSRFQHLGLGLVFFCAVSPKQSVSSRSTNTSLLARAEVKGLGESRRMNGRQTNKQTAQGTLNGTVAQAQHAQGVKATSSNISLRYRWSGVILI